MVGREPELEPESEPCARDKVLCQDWASHTFIFGVQVEQKVEGSHWTSVSVGRLSILVDSLLVRSSNVHTEDETCRHSLLCPGLSQVVA